jgi:alpha-ketoglutarate-dependent taurine dioxygenase
MREKLFAGLSLPLVIEPDSVAEGSPDMLRDWISDNREQLLEKMQSHGAVLLRGFNLRSAEDFERVAQVVSPNLMRYSGGDSPRERVSQGVYTSTNLPAEYEIPLHNEMSYTSNYPHIVMFYCDLPAAEGGETPLLDGRILLARLDPQLVETFRAKKLKYVQNLHGGEGLGKSWQETFEQDDPTRVEEMLRESGATFDWRDGETLHVEEVVDAVIEHPRTGEQVFFSQADQWHSSFLDEDTREILLSMMDEHDLYHNCFFGDDSEIDPAMLDQVRTVARQASVRFPWQQGDLLVVDNILTLHGRAPFKGPRRILVAMA